ncbi:MAG: class I SAM-dependent DNA methyltransferase, partial [Magnetospirillum sp.]|nr:class I SAM-dependent DNA methyltransferase [Magnetospirillum sp.]
SLESDHAPKTVADFLMRCLFTMFAEDVGLLKERSFTELLQENRPNPPVLCQMLTSLWQDMNSGASFSPVIRDAVPQFNGALYANATALALSAAQIDLLILAARADWREVEPAIFGTLLERALDEGERHKLGAHYTPRAYVERLVLPTIIEPLRAEWDDVKIAALTAANAGDLAGAIKAVKDFHHHLCSVTVLDPACGSGNFLYVTLEHMKRLEGEVVDLLVTELGEKQDALDLSSHTVDPHQFLGIEKNERAVPIAEMVLWIGHLQWYARSRPNFTAWPKPVLRQYGNIRAGDAVLAWRDIQLVRDDHGKPLSRWDGISKKSDPITGAQIPDETKRVEMERYLGPKPAEWPPADYIIGNPPFIGGKDLRQELGDGYAEALWAVYGKRVPNAADFIMYWWHKAADKVRTAKAKRFGFITTNSLPQTFNRRVLEVHMSGRHPVGLRFAIADHPWVKALNENEEEAVRDAAQVRVAMSVGVRGACDGKLQTVIAEKAGKDDSADVQLEQRIGKINADLTIGADVTKAQTLRANERVSSPGVKLHGAGFIVTPDQAEALGLGRIPGLDKHILAYRNGRDLTARPRGVMVIDLFGLKEDEVRQRFPETYQWVLERVKPERDQNNRETYRTSWWIFGEPRRDFRPALAGLPRYIATVETAKHRIFQFLDASIRPDNMLVNIASSDAYHLGVLSSRLHVTWALSAGGRLGVGNDPRYNKTRCFDTFPFPDASEARKDRIRTLAEELDALRKRQLASRPELTLTGLYNVLVKLRAGKPLDEDERAVNDKGLVGVLRKLHDDLNSAVADAYGWPGDLAEADILCRLVALNKQRRQEEISGKVRWLRPDFQTGRASTPIAKREINMELEEGEAIAALLPWPKILAEQVQAIRAVLARLGPQPSVEAIAKQFRGAKRDRVAEILQAMALMG